MERKDFIKSSLVMCGLSIVPSVILNSCTKSTPTAPTNVNFTLDLNNSANSALNAVGGSIVVNNVLVICTGGNVFDALSAICTHQGCTVGYDAARADIICRCHGGVYNLAGQVKGGPPPSALTKYTVTKNGSVLTVKS